MFYQLDIDYELSVTAYAAGDLRQGYESCRHLLLLNVREELTTVTMQNMWLYREHAQTETREVLEQLVAVMQPYAVQGGRLAEVAEYFADILKTVNQHFDPAVRPSERKFFEQAQSVFRR